MNVDFPLQCLMELRRFQASNVRILTRELLCADQPVTGMVLCDVPGAGSDAETDSGL